MLKACFLSLMIVIALLCSNCGRAQSMPTTVGETLSGKRIVLADTVKGHPVVIVAGFSRESGPASGDWVKSIRNDAVFSNVLIYQVAEIASAPTLIRGMIRNGMKKGLAPAQQDEFVVLTEDEQKWRTYFAVSSDGEPYVALIDASGKLLWRGHGAVAGQEKLLRDALR